GRSSSTGAPATIQTSVGHPTSRQRTTGSIANLRPLLRRRAAAYRANNHAVSAPASAASAIHRQAASAGTASVRPRLLTKPTPSMLQACRGGGSLVTSRYQKLIWTSWGVLRKSST